MSELMTLFLVIPCYNESAMLDYTIEQTVAKMDSLICRGMLSAASRIVFVNDGSKDDTWDIICNAYKNMPDRISGINLSRNRGHQNAVLAGLMTVKDQCDAAITMDADLQDDIDAVDGMVDAYYEGNDVVYGVRSARDTDTFFKRFTAEAFYKLIRAMGADIVYNHADFRLMSKRVLHALSEYREVNLFLRGIVPLIGFKSTSVYYKRKERLAGESKYPLKKMLSFAIDGITSFSVKPLRLIIYAGGFMCLVSILMFILLISGSIHDIILPVIFLIGGLQLVALGIIGEYIGKIYAEVKQRPRYIVSDYLYHGEQDGSKSTTHTS